MQHHLLTDETPAQAMQEWPVIGRESKPKARQNDHRRHKAPYRHVHPSAQLRGDAFNRIPSHLSQIASWTGPPMMRPLAVRRGSPSRTKYRPSGPKPSPHSWQLKQLSCHWPPTAEITTSSSTGFLQARQRGAVRREWHCRHQAKPSFSTKGVSWSNGCYGELISLHLESGGKINRTSPHSAQKKWPTCHSAPHATTTSPSIGVLQLLHRGLNSSWKSRWQ